ncbi:MAG: metallophosphoesterase [Alistipes finegoldii]
MLFAMWAFWVWMITVRRASPAILPARRLRRRHAAGICVAHSDWGTTRAGRKSASAAPKSAPNGFPRDSTVSASSSSRTFTSARSSAPKRTEPHRGQHQQPASRPVVFCGDLVNIRGSELDARAMRLLGGLRTSGRSGHGQPRRRVYIKDSIAHPPKRVWPRSSHAAEMGWRVLEDTTVYLRRGGDSISLTGLSFDPALRHMRHDPDLPPADLSGAYRGVPDSLYNITAVHIPQLWGQIADAGYGDLTLAGHVHSMQMKLRLLGRAFSPAQLLYTRWSGRYDEGGRTLYINDGTGYVVFPMRLGAYPEITLITLRRCE